MRALGGALGTPPNNGVSPQYLSCLTTSRSVTDKLAFDVGLQKDAAGKEGGTLSFLGSPSSGGGGC